MRIQKVRGQNRIQKQIEEWRLDNLTLNLANVRKRGRGHIDIIVHPWCDLSIIKSSFAEPKGRTRRQILTGLLDIYDNWKRQLNEYGNPYYLKIWLCGPRFSRSEVVCAIGENLNYYDNTFAPSPHQTFPFNHYGNLQGRLKKMNWNCFLDEDHFSEAEIGTEEQYASEEDYEWTIRWFNRIIRKPHNVSKLKDGSELHSFKRGYVWVGG